MTSGSQRVLIVEDDQGVRGLLAAALLRKGLSVDHAASGEDALPLLRETSYAVVLVDLILPGDVDGFQVLDAIEASARDPAPVVLVITAAERPLLDRLKAASTHGVIRKPFDPEELASVVAACAEIRERSTLETMAVTFLSTAPLLALLS